MVAPVSGQAKRIIAALGQAMLSAAHAADCVGKHLQSILLNRFFALAAQAVLAFGQALEGVLDSQQLIFLTPFQLKRHLLILQSVHPGQPPDRRIQLDHAGILRVGVHVLPDFLFQILQPFPKISQAIHVHAAKTILLPGKGSKSSPVIIFNFKKGLISLTKN